MRCIVCGLECVPYTRRKFCSLQCQRRAQYVRSRERKVLASRAPSPGAPPPQDTRAAAA